MRVWGGFFGLLLALSSTCAVAGQPTLDWLKTVAFAAHQTDYSGVFVYQYDNHVETSRITHVVETDSEYEKLESLDGPKREIIRHHDQVWCYTNHKMVQVASQEGRSRFPSLLPEQLSALGENYLVKEAGLQRVAGFDTQVILFQPKDSLRFTHKIWVHTDTGLLLKAAVLDDKNKIVEQYTFTQLKIGGEFDRSWILSSKAGVASGKSASGKSVKPNAAINPDSTKVGMQANSGWVVDAMPAGFKKPWRLSVRWAASMRQ